MSEQIIEQKQSRQGRSPAYPIIPLDKAVERIKEFYKKEGKHLVPIFSAYKAWGYGGKSSGARQTSSSLKQYGFIEYESSGENLQIRLTKLALNIVLDSQEISPERDDCYKEAALNPSIHKQLWEKYKTAEDSINLPSDDSVETFLKKDLDYNEAAAKLLLSVFKDTLSFANLDKPAFLSHSSKEKNIMEGNIMQPSAITVNPISPSPTPISLEKQLPNTRRSVFVLTEGDVILTFPDNLSQASVDDLNEYLKIFLNKARRDVEQKNKS